MEGDLPVRRGLLPDRGPAGNAVAVRLVLNEGIAEQPGIGCEFKQMESTSGPGRIPIGRVAVTMLKKIEHFVARVECSGSSDLKELAGGHLLDVGASRHFAGQAFPAVEDRLLGN